MDTRALVGQMAAKYDTRLDANDPAFMLVEMCHLVLAEQGNQIMAQLDDMSAKATQVAEASAKTADQVAGTQQTMLEIAKSVAAAREKMDKLGYDAATIVDALKNVNVRYEQMYRHLNERIGEIDVDAITAQARWTTALAGLVIAGAACTAGVTIAFFVFAR